MSADQETEKPSKTHKRRNRRVRRRMREEKNNKKKQDEATSPKQQQKGGKNEKKRSNQKSGSENKNKDFKIRSRKNHRGFCKDVSCGSIHFTGTKIDVHFARKHIRDDSAPEWAAKMREEIEKIVKENPQLNFIPTHVCVQENHLRNEGVRYFTEALIHDRIQVDSLKLYRNEINDEGAMYVAQLIGQVKYPVTEIHLSHNLITEISAEAILLSLKREDQLLRYPALPLSAPHHIIKPAPLWLRLEQNFINLDAIAPVLMENGFQVCHAMSHKDKGHAVCGPKKCEYDWETVLQDGQTPVHLFMFHMQYKPEALNTKLDELKALKIDNEVGGGENKSNKNSSSKSVGTGPGPLILFLDTSAVFYFADSQNCLSFDNLLKKAAKEEFGWNLAQSQRTNCAILFTVNRELDGLKSSERFRSKIAALHKHIFPAGEEAGILELLDLKSEAQLKRDGKINSTVNNDFSILQQIQKYEEMVKDSGTGNVLLLTGDRSQITLARRMNINVLQTDQLSEYLEKYQNVTWNSEFIWKFYCRQARIKYKGARKYLDTLKMAKYYPEVLGALENLLVLLPDEERPGIEAQLNMDLWKKCLPIMGMTDNDDETKLQVIDGAMLIDSEI